MKKWMIFVSGVVSGILVTFLFAVLYTSSRSDTTNMLPQDETEKAENKDIEIFDETGEVIEEPSVKVFQVLAKDAALVNGYNKEIDDYLGMVYLLVNKDGQYYYDDQIVKTSKEKVFKQVGIYRYQTKNDFVKTVPVIELMDKE